jgi:hypothetical protein
MKFVLLIGFLTLSVCAAFVTVRLRSLNQRPDNLPPIRRNDAARPVISKNS